VAATVRGLVLVDEVIQRHFQGAMLPTHRIRSAAAAEGRRGSWGCWAWPIWAQAEVR
jgi:hypothetical protein